MHRIVWNLRSASKQEFLEEIITPTFHHMFIVIIMLVGDFI
jgi:hypothetical protein